MKKNTKTVVTIVVMISLVVIIWVLKPVSFDDRMMEYEYTDDMNAVVIIPLFTTSAYGLLTDGNGSGGFYDYFRETCGDECLVVDVCKEQSYDSTDVCYLRNSSSNGSTLAQFKKLGYPMIDDVVWAEDPDIIDNYDTVILVHNEYVTQEMFDEVTTHSNVIYLYPNALFAEVEYDGETITLIRGHEYPRNETQLYIGTAPDLQGVTTKIVNGFSWEWENTHPYEFDRKCDNHQWRDVNNGKQLLCYPHDMYSKNMGIWEDIDAIVRGNLI